MQALPDADSAPGFPEASLLPPPVSHHVIDGTRLALPPAEQENREQCDAELRRQLQASGTPTGWCMAAPPAA